MENSDALKQKEEYSDMIVKNEVGVPGEDNYANNQVNYIDEIMKYKKNNNDARFIIKPRTDSIELGSNRMSIDDGVKTENQNSLNVEVDDPDYINFDPNDTDINNVHYDSRLLHEDNNLIDK